MFPYHCSLSHVVLVFLPAAALATTKSPTTAFRAPCTSDGIVLLSDLVYGTPLPADFPHRPKTR
jgi:hypothetical protein